MEAAFHEVARQASLCIAAGIPVFSPIAHSHPLAQHSYNAHSYDVWLGLDVVFMKASTGIIVCQMESWEKSSGLHWEIEWYKAEKKPIVYMTPNEPPVPLTKAFEIAEQSRH